MTLRIVQNISNVDNTKGRVVSFYYERFKHDPYPTIITTGPMSYERISGINIHYLTFPVYRALLNRYAGNTNFNYYIIKNSILIKSAFRSYKIFSILRAKVVNWKSIIAILSILRNYSQQELKAIRDAIDQQMSSRNPEILNELLGKITANYLATQAAQNINSQNDAQE